MTKFWLIAIILLLTQDAIGQKTSSTIRHATEKQQELFDKSQDCMKYVSKPPAERLKNYPFNIASQIQLVSFKRLNDTLNGVVIANEQDSLPKKNGSIVYSRLFEVKSLTSTQVNKLTDILYSYGYRKQLKNTGLIYTGTSLQCYNPRNAILFLDASGKVFEYVEICFECEKAKESSSRISLGIMCNQKLQLLRRFFKNAGITYGTTKSSDTAN